MNARLLLAALATTGLLQTSCSKGIIDRSRKIPGEDDGADGGAGQGDGGYAFNECGDHDTSCTPINYGPPNKMFDLQGDPKPDPGEKDQGVGRDKNGWIGLDATHGSFNFLWIANSEDWGRGTVSKLDSKTVREVARYFTVTCGSLPTGNLNACDGTNGCCSRDDYQSFQNRLNNMPSGPHQAVNLTANSPSRTAVDFNGDMFVSNRAFSGQSSLTKIANDVSECVDRNKNGKIDTSTDVNGDGQIQTDCNGDGQPDDIASVKAKPCLNGKPQEFYGLDDECVLFTTNTNTNLQLGRPLALGRGSVDFGPSDAWAGGYNNGKFFRIDGTSGLTKAEAQLAGGCQPYGAAVDATGILWAPNLGTGLCYFDIGNPKDTRKVRSPSNVSQQGYGITLDRDQNVWTAGLSYGAFRYTPDRSQGTAKLDQGVWTAFQNPGSSMGANGQGRGIAADSRSMGSYYVWMARDGGWVTRIDASANPPPKGQDLIVDSSSMPAMRVAGNSTIGCGVDSDQNVWGISYGGSVATKILVDPKGAMTAPDLTSGAMGQNKCPAGSRCALRDASTEPSPYTYSDFTGFGLRNFTNPHGSYSYVIKGCGDTETRWLKVSYDSIVPGATKLSLRVRSGKAAMPDKSWGMWTPEATTSPVELYKSMQLLPNGKDSDYLQIEFQFSTLDKMSTPKLKSFQVLYECVNRIG